MQSEVYVFQRQPWKKCFSLKVRSGALWWISLSLRWKDISGSWCLTRIGIVLTKLPAKLLRSLLVGELTRAPIHAVLVVSSIKGEAKVRLYKSSVYVRFWIYVSFFLHSNRPWFWLILDHWDYEEIISIGSYD